MLKPSNNGKDNSVYTLSSQLNLFNSSPHYTSEEDSDSKTSHNSIIIGNNSKSYYNSDDIIIGDYLGYLTPNEKEKNKYYCPVCGGHNLSVAPDGVKWNCFNNDSPEHRSEIAKFLHNNYGSVSDKPKAKKQALKRKTKPIASPKITQVELATIESLDSIDFPKPEIKTGEFKVGKAVYSQETKFFYIHDKTQWKARFDYLIEGIGRIKECQYWHIDAENKPQCKKGDSPWLPYGLLQIQSLQQDLTAKDIFLVEGEKCVEAVQTMGFLAIDYKGINKENIDLISSQFRALIMLPDNDGTGKTELERIRKLTNKAIHIDLPNLPSGGDIVDYIQSLKNQSPTMSNKEIQEQLVKLINQQLSELSKVILSEQPTEKKKEKEEEKKDTPQSIANELVEQLKDNWVFAQPTTTWYQWNGKRLIKKHERSLKILIRQYLESNGVEYRTPKFIDNVVELLSLDLKLTDETIDHWNAKGFINFDNGILDLANNSLEEHSISYRFTSLLPRPYCPINIDDKSIAGLIKAVKTEAPTFFNWAMSPLNNNEKAVLKLLAVMNGVLTYKFSQLEYFLYLVGKPGTGKGTFLRLLEKLVGQGNHTGFTVSKLGDGNEIDLIIDKQLAVSGDVRELPKPSAIENLLRLTGKDEVSYKKVYKEASNARMLGTIAMASNDPVFVGNVKGIDRRICLVEFDNPIADHLRNSQIEDLLELELPQLTAIALAMPDTLTTQFIKGVGDGQLSEFQGKQWEMKCRVDSIASWINDNLIYEIGCSEPIGTAKSDGHYLYRNYLDYCEAARMTPKQLNNFSTNLVELCQEIGWNVTKKKSNIGYKIWNIRLRVENEETLTHLEKIENSLHSLHSLHKSSEIKGSQPSLGVHSAFTQPSLSPHPVKTEEDGSLSQERVAFTSEDLVKTSEDQSEDLKALPDKESEDREDLNVNFLISTEKDNSEDSSLVNSEEENSKPMRARTESKITPEELQIINQLAEQNRYLETIDRITRLLGWGELGKSGQTLLTEWLLENYGVPGYGRLPEDQREAVHYTLLALLDS